MVSTAYEMGWSEIDNARLLSAAELEFDAMITTDQSIRYQQNFAGRRLGIIVLPTTKRSFGLRGFTIMTWPRRRARNENAVHRER